MAVPKKRTGHSAQGKRRSNWKATKPTIAKCPNCGATVLAHTVCTACGQYNGKVVSKKGQVEVPEVKEEVKETTKAKKSTKKAAETPAVEEKKAEVNEEVKEEAAEETKVEEEVKEEASEEKAE